MKIGYAVLIVNDNYKDHPDLIEEVASLGNNLARKHLCEKVFTDIICPSSPMRDGYFSAIKACKPQDCLYIVEHIYKNNLSDYRSEKCKIDLESLKETLGPDVMVFHTSRKFQKGQKR